MREMITHKIDKECTTCRDPIHLYLVGDIMLNRGHKHWSWDKFKCKD